MKTCTYCHRYSPDDARHCTHEDCFEGRWTKICPPLYRSTDPAQIPNQEALKTVLGYKYSDKGLFLAGPTGRGKTRSAFLLLRRLHEEDYRVDSLDCLDFGHKIAALFHEGTGVDWVRGLSRVPMLFMDDVDKVKLTERVESELFGLFERRIANCLPTIITTNATGNQLAERMDDLRGPAFVRRLQKFCDLICF